MVKFLEIPFACFLLGDGDTNAVWIMPLNLIMLEQQTEVHNLISNLWEKVQVQFVLSSYFLLLCKCLQIQTRPKLKEEQQHSNA